MTRRMLVIWALLVLVALACGLALAQEAAKAPAALTPEQIQALPYPDRAQRFVTDYNALCAKYKVQIEGRALYDKDSRPVMLPDGRQAVQLYPADTSQAQ